MVELGNSVNIAFQMQMLLTIKYLAIYFDSFVSQNFRSMSLFFVLALPKGESNARLMGETT